MVRNSLRYVSWKDYKGVTSGLKAVYQAPTEEAALMALDKFAGAWDENTRKSAKAGVRTGKTSTRSSAIHRISARPSTRRMPSNH
jgi:putative transposase